MMIPDDQRAWGIEVIRCIYGCDEQDAIKIFDLQVVPQVHALRFGVRTVMTNPNPSEEFKFILTCVGCGRTGWVDQPEPGPKLCPNCILRGHSLWRVPGMPKPNPWGNCLCGQRGHCGSCSCCRPPERGASKAEKRERNRVADKHTGERNKRERKS